MHTAVIASLRKTFSAESFKAHQERVANDTEARRQREAQRAHWTTELPKLQAKAARLAKLVADTEDTGELLDQYQLAKKQVQEAKDSVAYLDKIERDDVMKAADTAATPGDLVRLDRPGRGQPRGGAPAPPQGPGRAYRRPPDRQGHLGVRRV